MTVSINYPVAGQVETNHIVSTAAAVMSNGLVIFNVVGDIQILSLVSECYTDNGATATTLRYNVTASNATSATISAASASLANLTAGYAVALTAASGLAEVPTLSSNNAGVVLNTASRGVRIPSGTINLTIGVGSTTGTWAHYLKYEPLQSGAYVTAAF
jgi:hypothetical protein